MKSRAIPPPRLTQVNGSSATVTGKPVSCEISLSRSRSNAPPPVNTIPRSAMSDDNSGGVCSRATLTALTIPLSGSVNAFCTSSELTIKVFGTPSAMLRPRTSTSSWLFSFNAEPTSFLMRSAVVSPITQPCVRRTCVIIASSNISPPIRIDSA